MGNIDKLIERLKSEPKDFTWKELKRIMTYLGYGELSHGKTSGSRVKFHNKELNSLINLHRPHNPEILKPYQLEYILEKLSEVGLI